MCYFFLLYIPLSILFAFIFSTLSSLAFFPFESWLALVPSDPTVGCRGVVWGGCVREGSAALGTRLHHLHMPSKQMFPPILKPPCEKAETEARAKLTQGQDEIEV